MWCVISLLWHSSEKYLTLIVSISCSTDFSWISAGEAGRKRWTAPGFSWFRHQHQAGYGACQGLKVWSVISVSVKILWFLGRNQLFWLLVCVLPQVQVDLPFSCLQTSSAFCLGLGGFSISTMWTSTPPMESRRLRSALLFQHEETLGSARSFDGALLFLPHRLHGKVPWYPKHSWDTDSKNQRRSVSVFHKLWVMLCRIIFTDIVNI